MLISLYRDTGRGELEYSVLFDRGRVVLRRTTLIGRPAEPRETVIGGGSELQNDLHVLEVVRDALGRGAVALYGYVPAVEWPLTSAFLRERAGVEVEPNLSDGLPVWPPGVGRRRGRPLYLLFTVLNSVAK